MTPSCTFEQLSFFHLFRLFDTHLFLAFFIHFGQSFLLRHTCYIGFCLPGPKSWLPPWTSASGWWKNGAGPRQRDMRFCSLQSARGFHGSIGWFFGSVQLVATFRGRALGKTTKAWPVVWWGNLGQVPMREIWCAKWFSESVFQTSFWW